MRKFVIWNIVCLLLFIAGCMGALTTLVGVTTTDSAESVGQFIELLESRDFESAFGQASSVFQSSQDVVSMRSNFDNAGVAKLELVPWRDRTLERRLDSDMRAYLTNGYGDQILLWIKMARENDQWKVLAMADELRRHIGPGMWFQTIPSEEELRKLTDSSISGFAKGLRDNNFEEFYGSMSRAFQVGVPFTQFERGYQFLIDKGVNITGVEEARAIYDLRLPPAQADPDAVLQLGGPAAEFQGSFHGLALIEEFKPGSGVGELAAAGVGVEERNVDVLIVSGFYPIDSGPVAFQFRYIYEHPNWMLFRVLVKEPDLTTIEPHHCIQWLLTREVMDPSLCFQK